MRVLAALPVANTASPRETVARAALNLPIAATAIPLQRALRAWTRWRLPFTHLIAVLVDVLQVIVRADFGVSTSEPLPVPDSPITSGDSGSSLVTLRVVARDPEAWGPNSTLIVQLWPGLMRLAEQLSAAVTKSPAFLPPS